MTTLVVAGALALALPAAAQDDKPLDLSKVPTQGPAPKDFVPPGVRIEATHRGDLDKNGTEDTVLQLVEEGPAQDADGVSVPHPRALLVLLSEGKGLRRVGASNQVLACTTCAGTLGGGPGEDLVKIDKGVILVNQLRGSRESVQTLLRFRYDAASRRVAFIGEDVEKTDRLSGRGEKVSTNLLTGQRIAEQQRYDPKKDTFVTTTSKKSKVAVKKAFLEDVNIDSY
jgi:hypothetical protein